MTEDVGRRPATVDEAREMLGIPTPVLELAQPLALGAGHRRVALRVPRRKRQEIRAPLGPFGSVKLVQLGVASTRRARSGSCRGSASARRSGSRPGRGRC